MIVRSIELIGWMPFKHARLDLPAGPIAVVGAHAGDERRSNRAGKTALLEAILWCLYGAHRKRLDDAIINRECSTCQVIVDLGDLIIKRSRPRGHSTKLEVIRTETGEITTGEAGQQVIEQVIGLSLDDYTATACFRQGEVESIIMLKPGERLALVSEWLQHSKWFDAKKIQSTKTTAVAQQLLTKRGALQVMAPYLLTKEAANALTTELDQLQLATARLEQHIGNLSIDWKNATDAANQLQRHHELAELRVLVADLKQRLRGRADAERQRAEALQHEAVAASVKTSTRTAVDDLLQVKAEGFDGTCPIMCDACPVADRVEERVRSTSALLDNRRESLAIAQTEWGKARAAAQEASNAVRTFEQWTAQYQQAIARGQEISKSLTLTLEQAANAPQADPIRARWEQMQQKSREIATRVGQIEQTLASALTHETRYAELVNEIEHAEEASRVSHLALRAISSVPARIAAQQLGELEQEANQLLAGTGVSLRFSWARELAEKASVCDECGFIYASKRGDKCPTCQAVRGKKLAQELELLCDDGSGGEEDARFNSGGTRAIVGSAIRLAASAMLRRLRSSQAAWAIVDEPFGSLDAENREQLARTFAGMLGSVGLQQALVVSHDAALLAALPHRIVIDKDGTMSTARLE